jgi:hypothetical protein
VAKFKYVGTTVTNQNLIQQEIKRLNWIWGWVDLRAGMNDMEKKFLILPGLELRHLRRPARSQSLHRLRYRGSVVVYIIIIYIYIYIFFNLCGGTLSTAATTDLLYQPRMIGDGDCGEIGGIKTGRENRSTRRKPAPAPLCPPQIPHD